MMPIIRPLPSQSATPTEYQNEQALFAELQAGVRRRKRWPPRWRAVLRGVLRWRRGPRPGLPGAGAARVSP